MSSTSGSTSNTSNTASNLTSQGTTDADVQVPPRTTVAPKKASSNSADTCTWYTGARCYMPRDCYDCVNTALKRDACAVDPNGNCVSMTSYTEYARRQGKPNDPAFLGYFPAANFTYCTSADDTCQQCKQQWRQQYWDSGGVVPKGETCLGASGCICLAACEMPNRAASILTSQCSGSGIQGPGSKVVTRIYLGVAACGMLLLGLLVLKAWLRKHRDIARAQMRRERRERCRNRPLRSGPVLALTGWNSLRDKLLETEREFVEGKPSLIAPGAQQGAIGAVAEEDGDFAYAGGQDDVDASGLSSDDEEGQERRSRPRA